MRLAMFALLTRKNGSVRVVCYQFASSFRERGIEVEIFPPSSIGLYEFFYERFAKPRWASLLLKAIYWYFIVLPWRFVQLIRALRADIIFIQRGMLRHNSPPHLEAIVWLVHKKLLGKKIIYNYDDAMYIFANPRYFQWRFEMADYVMTGNQNLARYAIAFNKNVVVIESVVDTKYYRVKQHAQRNVPVIGWAGTMVKDVLPFSTALSRVASKYPVVFHVVSVEQLVIDDPGVKIINKKWSLQREVENLLEFDIGVMPLPDNDFNAAKEGYKIKQYMAVGLPVVCSPVGKNSEIVQDGSNGFWATADDEWVEKLGMLISDWRLRARMGEAGRQFIESRYSLEKGASEFVDFLERVYRDSA